MHKELFNQVISNSKPNFLKYLPACLMGRVAAAVAGTEDARFAI
jgi:hypothetical protein